MPMHLTDENFEEEVMKTDVPVLVDFWAEWCMPCKMIAPLLKEIAEEYRGKIKVCKVNVEEAPVTSAEHNVMSIPTLIIFKDGEEKQKTVGAVSKEKIISMFKSYLG
ncbi:MAG: thioredoxin [Candidatus Omnitrophota bacterium]